MASQKDQRFTLRKLQLDGRGDLPSSIPLAYPDDCEYHEADYVIVKQQRTTSPKHLIITSDAISLLNSLADKPVAVVSICGPYRTGKSYFLSRVLGFKKAFKLGHSTKACTRGIWLSTYVLDCDSYTILFLDTEGADAVGEAETSESFTTSLLTLTTLLSSFLIYNSKGVPQKSDLRRMKYFTKFTESILARGTSDVKLLRQSFPSFLWLLRDVELPMIDEDEDDEKEIPPTEYIIKYVLETGDKEVGGKIHKLFPNFQCIKVSRPFHSPKEIPEKDDENSAFNRDIDEAIAYILSNVRTKIAHRGNVAITGSSLAILVKEYAYALSEEGAFPDLEVSWEVVIDQTISRSIEPLVDHYTSQMHSRTAEKLPIEHHLLLAIHDEELSSALQMLHKKIKSLMPRSNEIISKKYSSKLVNRIANEENGIVKNCQLLQFVNENEKKSDSLCMNLYKQLRQQRLPLKELITEYNMSAVGPAKLKIYEDHIAVIPGKPKGLSIVHTSYKGIEICWEIPEIHPQSAYEYKYQYECTGEKSEPNTTTNLMTRISNCQAATSYTIKICAVSKSGQRSEYSQLVAKTAPGPPGKPIIEQFDIIDCYKGKLTFKSPTTKDKRGSPITSVTTRLFSDGLSGMDKRQVFTGIDRATGEYSAAIVAIPNIKSSKPVSLEISWENSIGRSEQSKPLRILSTNFVPGPPGNIRTVGRTKDTIKIRFEISEINPAAVDHYAIYMQKKSEGLVFLKKTLNLSFVSSDLESNTEYIFYVTAVNAKDVFFNAGVLKCETKFSKAGAGAAGAGVVAASILATPLTGAAIVPLASTGAIIEGASEKSAKKIIGGILGLLASPITIPVGLIVGAVAAPVGGIGGGVAAHYAFADSDDDIDESDSESTNTHAAQLAVVDVDTLNEVETD